MSYLKCISNAIKEGVVSKEQGAKQLALFEDLSIRFKGMGLDPTEAEIKAAKMAYDLAKIELAEKKRFLLKQKKVQDKIMAYIKSYKNINGEECDICMENKELVEAYP